MTIAQSSSVSFKTTIQGQGLVDSNGNCAIPFLPPDKSMIYTGAITIYDSPPSAVWMVLLNHQIVDTVVGQSTCSNIQLSGNESIQFATSGLVGFINVTFHATFFALVSPADNTELIIPGHDSLPSPSLPPRQIVNGVNYTVSGGPAHAFDIPLLPSDQSLLLGVGVGSGPCDFAVNGNTTHLNYLTTYKIYSGQFLQIPAYGTLDNTVHVVLSNIPSNAIVTIAATPDNVQVGSPVQSTRTQVGNGPCIYQVTACPAGAVTPILSVPPSDLMYVIYSISIQADTTTLNVPAHCRVSTNTNDVTLVGENSAATGIRTTWVYGGNGMPIQDGLNCHNLTAVLAGVNVFYDSLPIS